MAPLLQFTEFCTYLHWFVSLLCHRSVNYFLQLFSLALNVFFLSFWVHCCDYQGSHVSRKILEKYPRKTCIFLVVQMENKKQQCSTQFVFTIAWFWTANVHILLHAEFSAMDYTLNTVSKCRFSLYLNIRGLQAGPGKFFMVSCKVLEKSWIFFFVSKRVGTLYCACLVSAK